MTEFYRYVLESAVCLVFFYAGYFYLFRKASIIQFGRYYLLSAMVFSFLIPLLDIALMAPKSVQHYQVFMENITLRATNQLVENQYHINFRNVMANIYLAGLMWFFLRFLWQLFQIFHMGVKNRKEMIGKQKIIITSKKIAPFSFLNHTFMNEGMWKSEFRESILSHEFAHIKRMHTIDILMTELLHIFQWFNPLVYLYKNTLKEIHEYEADQEVLTKGFNRLLYQKLIINQFFGYQFFHIGSNLNKSLTKKRIIMMTKNINPRKGASRFLVIIPVTMVLIVLFSFKLQNKVFITENIKANPLTTKENISLPDSAFVMVDEMPKFQGENANIFKEFITNRLKYPADASKEGISGKVYVQFIVNKKGEVSNVKIIRQIFHDANGKQMDNYPSLEKEAVDAVTSSPKWTPGKLKGKPVDVTFTFPIEFNLQ